MAHFTVYAGKIESDGESNIKYAEDFSSEQFPAALAAYRTCSDYAFSYLEYAEDDGSIKIITLESRDEHELDDSAHESTG